MISSSKYNKFYVCYTSYKFNTLNYNKTLSSHRSRANAWLAIEGILAEVQVVLQGEDKIYSSFKATPTQAQLLEGMYIIWHQEDKISIYNRVANRGYLYNTYEDTLIYDIFILAAQEEELPKASSFNNLEESVNVYADISHYISEDTKCTYSCLIDEFKEQVACQFSDFDLEDYPVCVYINRCLQAENISIIEIVN